MKCFTQQGDASLYIIISKEVIELQISQPIDIGNLCHVDTRISTEVKDLLPGQDFRNTHRILYHFSVDDIYHHSWSAVQPPG